MFKMLEKCVEIVSIANVIGEGFGRLAKPPDKGCFWWNDILRGCRATSLKRYGGVGILILPKQGARIEMNTKLF